MEELYLIEPTPVLHGEFLAMISEYQQRGETISFHQLAVDDFEFFLKRIHDFASGANLGESLVPMDTFWLMRGGKTIIGESRLRHKLTSALELEGGHIGYAIRPSFRRQGYGTRILALTLEKAFQFGLKRVLITCDTDNIGSAHIIEKNGGLLENYTLSPDSGKQISRYWIEIFK